ncbi:glycosyltransferase family 2 protein [Parapedobacter sp. DT-150]|uniref:glycosyltransferase family 2 protein n=1 Tax=Parapedobacter sp. DT-150 TaxID=3396162 RepID=UPI003F1B4C26
MIPLVSVIIPFYNMQEFLVQTIEWALESTYLATEIILVDDGSTDDSGVIAKGYAERFEQVSFLRQENQGVSVARNHGISYARGAYILPLDGDDRICATFIEEAVKVLEGRPEVKVVTAEGEFFGDKAGPRKLPDFDINLLARKNILHVSALYRKSDWAVAGGYCGEMKGREDWDFWIAMLKDGGDVVKLPIVGYQYRIRPNSKRIRTRKLKRQINDLLNKRHAGFFKRTLGGPLRIHRTWSKPYNKLLAFLGLLE